MSEEKEVLQEIRNAISELQSEKADAVNKIADAIRDLIKKYDGVAELAIALVGAELAAKEIGA